MRRSSHPQLHRSVTAIADHLLPAGVAADAEASLPQKRRRKHVRELYPAQLAVVAHIVLEDTQIASCPRRVAPTEPLPEANRHAAVGVKPMVDLPEKAVPVVHVISGRLIVVAQPGAVWQRIVWHQFQRDGIEPADR